MAEGSDGGRELAFAFGPFQLQPKQQLLRRGDVPVRLGARATELLIALVERAGEVLSREALEARVWPTVVVEETSLRVHMSALRRALSDGTDGARYITNVPGRGYCFVAPVVRLALPAPHEQQAATDLALYPSDKPAAPAGPLPTRLSSVVGRDAAIAMLAEQLDQRRLATLLGPGGIGKTTVAIAAAERFLARRPEHGVCFVDLSLISDPFHVAGSLAAKFGLVDFPDDPLGALAQLLGKRPTLLVLDSCEHVVEAVAAVASVLLERAPGVRMLVTSRELIGVEGEWVHRLPTLDLPEHPPTAEQALDYSAIRLLVERARARVEGFELSDADAPLAAELCRHLDGLPLAIEIAAARLEQFGLRGLVGQVEAGFLHLKRGRRTGAPRHEALCAMLDWSHRLLTEPEQQILRRIAVFRSPFSLRSAIRVASDATLSDSDVINGLAGLRAKSLLNRVVLDDVVKHQLLEQTRAYALEKLAESGDENGVRRHHALLVIDLLGEAQRNWPKLGKRQWMAVHGSLLMAIRNALQWALSPDGDALIGATLAARSWPMARYLFLQDYEAVIRSAIQALDGAEPPPLALLIELQLGVAAHVQERLGTGAETRAAYAHAAELARQSPDAAHRIEAEIGQVLDAMGSGDAPRALAATARIRSLAQSSGDEVAAVVADRLSAQALHFKGDQVQARQLALAVRDHAVQRGPLASLAGVVDHRISMAILLARTHWLGGTADQALATALDSLALAEKDSTLAVCQSLALAVCPVLLWRGDDDEALLHAGTLLTQAEKLGSGQWLALAQGYVEIAEARRLGAGLRPVHRWATIDAPAGFPFVQDQLLTLDGSRWHDECLQRARSGQAGWCAAETLRLHALRLLDAGAVDEAQAALLQSLAIAADQQAHAWTLRSTISLARLWQQQGRHREAFDALQPVLRRFTEGTDAADPAAAAVLLGELRAHCPQAAW